MIKRRTLVKGSLALPVALAKAGSAQPLKRQPGAWLNDDCGVASGDPRADSVTLWTRIPEVGRDDPAGVRLRYEVSRSQDFAASELIAHGEVIASEGTDFTVRVRVHGLEPFTVYYYRFVTDAGFVSVTGRTKTAPRPGQQLPSLRFAAVSCQMFSAGHYTAYAHLANEDVDFCLHLGDHIYEVEAGRGGSGDPLGGRTAKTLTDYRAKYRYYLTDPNLREVRRLFPWIDLWDDHEVVNDYSGAVDRASSPAQFAAAYQAFAEYMPFESQLSSDADGTPQLQLYRRLPFGDLLDVVVLDGRQYRTPVPCASKFLSPGCDGMRDPTHTMLGAPQKQWFFDTLGASRGRWKIVLNEVMMAPLRLGATREVARDGDRLWLNLDQWDGYPQERAELLDFMHRHVDNVLVMTGDIHAAATATLTVDPEDSRSPAAALEVVTTSVTSTSLGETLGPIFGPAAEALLRLANPHLGWTDISRHGYTVVIATDVGVEVQHKAVSTIARPTAALSLARRTVVAAR